MITMLSSESLSDIIFSQKRECAWQLCYNAFSTSFFFFSVLRGQDWSFFYVPITSKNSELLLSVVLY